MALNPLLDAAVASGRVTAKSWEEQLEPLAEKLPRVASPEAKAVLEIWASDTFEVDPAARAGMRDFLLSRGYAMPSSYATPSPDLVPKIDGGNVTTPDALFEQLIAASGRGDANATIAVLDSGVELDHPALADKVAVNSGEVAGRRHRQRRQRQDRRRARLELRREQPAATVEWHDNPHGTHVAGLATRGTERIGLIPLRVTDWNTAGVKVADAIDYAVDQGAQVVNLSLNVQSDLELVREAMARHPNVLFVVSAGNQAAALNKVAPDELLSTIKLPNVAVVGASNSEGWVEALSNYGARYVDLAANGTALSTVPGGYAFMQGTSMAAPNVTAVAAKCLALDPSLDPATLKTLLSISSRPVSGWVGKAASGGVVDERVAMQLAAVRGLVSRSVAPEVAAEQLGLAGSERATVLALLDRLPAARQLAGFAAKASASKWLLGVATYVLSFREFLSLMSDGPQRIEADDSDPLARVRQAEAAMAQLRAADEAARAARLSPPVVPVEAPAPGLAVRDGFDRAPVAAPSLAPSPARVPNPGELLDDARRTATGALNAFR
ncbi:MAG: S8 family serine peptidase, partial [Myxococcaceae bacterium]|nr:S8 family serine peptidase [Myxococcaceae bacterium]